MPVVSLFLLCFGMLSSKGAVFFLQYCSDNEDLFGDYDSFLEDSSVLAKLEDAEQIAWEHDMYSSVHSSSAVDPNPKSLQPSKNGPEKKQAGGSTLTDSILEALGDEPFEDVPGSQLQFQEQVLRSVKRSKLQDEDKTSTPFRAASGNSGMAPEANMEDRTKKLTRGRKSMADQLKKTMLCNAATPAAVSRSVTLKEAIVSEEISVAMQAMETVSAETTDLGPFFGLPSKVKDLMYTLKGIKSLYGKKQFAIFFMPLVMCVLVIVWLSG